MEKLLEAKIKELTRRLEDARERFIETDCHETMHLVDTLEFTLREFQYFYQENCT